MNDRTFEIALTTVTIIVLVWIVAGIALLLLHPVAVLLTGIAVEAVAGIVLLRLWGRDYMGRRF
ncbi:MAG: hypothetical protein HY671_09330 [Chloroflexi bacterium]|nr:hypothetical protein [Chloroflexota bacterium]